MLIVNYNPDTGRVIGFNLKSEPYITLDADTRTPLPDRYSYYVVVDGELNVHRREPTVEDIRADIRAEIAEIQTWMRQGIDYVVALICGDIKKTDTEWIQYLLQRSAKRDKLKQLQEALDNAQDSAQS